MLNAQETLDQYYNEMRWRILSLAADWDRVQRGAGGMKMIESDARLAALKKCVSEILSPESGRAERVQMILSDMTPPPSR